MMSQSFDKKLLLVINHDYFTGQCLVTCDAVFNDTAILVTCQEHPHSLPIKSVTYLVNDGKNITGKVAIL